MRCTIIHLGQSLFNIASTSTEPLTTESALQFILLWKTSVHFLFYRHRDRHAPTRLQLQLCNMQFHTPFTVTKRPRTHQMLPQCTTGRPKAGGVTHHWVSLWPHDYVMFTESASTCMILLQLWIWHSCKQGSGVWSYWCHQRHTCSSDSRWLE